MLAATSLFSTYPHEQVCVLVDSDFLTRLPQAGQSDEV
jgi:hypothetical protein